MVKTEERYDGYSLQIKGDVRWMLEDQEADQYSMRVWRDDAILVKLPAMEYSLIHNKDEFDVNDDVPESVINAMDDARHHFEENKKNRMFRYILIEFPPGTMLSSKLIFSEAGDNEELDYDIVQIEANDKVTEHWLHFTVARTDTRVQKRGKVEKKSKKSKAASKLANLANTNMMSG